MITTKEITVLLQEAGYNAQHCNDYFVQMSTDNRTYIISVQETESGLSYCNISIIYSPKGMLTSFGSTGIVSSDIRTAQDAEELLQVYNDINYKSINVKICNDLEGQNTTNLSSGFWFGTTEEYLDYFNASLEQLNSAADEVEENLFNGQPFCLSML